MRTECSKGLAMKLSPRRTFQLEGVVSPKTLSLRNVLWVFEASNEASELEWSEGQKRGRITSTPNAISPSFILLSVAGISICPERLHLLLPQPVLCPSSTSCQSPGPPVLSPKHSSPCPLFFTPSEAAQGQPHHWWPRVFPQPLLSPPAIPISEPLPRCLRILHSYHHQDEVQLLNWS